MISTAILYEYGRNFMNAEELRAIAVGKLSEYLDSYRKPEERVLSDDGEGNVSVMLDSSRYKEYKPDP